MVMMIWVTIRFSNLVRNSRNAIRIYIKVVVIIINIIIFVSVRVIFMIKVIIIVITIINRIFRKSVSEECFTLCLFR